MTEVVIASAARTAIGTFGGALGGVSAVELGVVAAKSALERAGIDKKDIDEVIVGNVLSAGQGQNISRQVSLGAGLDVTVPTMNVGKLCGSGLRAVTMAAQIIKAGDADVILAGGTESMTNAPYILQGHRFGVKMGDNTLADTLLTDGLHDAFNKYHMGVTAENIAEERNISREDQDAFALASQEKARTAMENDVFREEIAPVAVPKRKGDPVVFDTDEHPRFDTSMESLQKLSPAFRKNGTVTAGNASGINDGAAMLVVCSRRKADSLSLPILGVIRGYASAGVDPSVMGLGVVPATRLALQKAGLAVGDLDLVEANEAFAAQALAVTRELEIPPEITNIHGGAIALGHPIGASGARILTTLLYAMRRRNAKYGLATLCIGGGMGTALIVERPANSL